MHKRASAEDFATINNSALLCTVFTVCVAYRRLGTLRYVVHIRYQVHARFLAQSRKNLVKRHTFQLNEIRGGATAQRIEQRLLAG